MSGITKERIVVEIVLGIDRNFARQDDKHKALEDLDTKITRRIGGITRTNAVGTWTSGSQDGEYSGEIERDDSYLYTLSLMPDEEDEILAGVRADITQVVRQYDLPVDHVHINRYPTTEAIFSISDQP
ncbi:MAG: hypothetical protein ACPGRX_01435 [Bdellovibrionales bacterium]